MYGDAAREHASAASLCVLADKARTDAGVLSAGLAGAWVSSAATAFQTELDQRARVLSDAAADLDAAAGALDNHARSVDAVKQAIVEAQHWVSDRWNDVVSVA